MIDKTTIDSLANGVAPEDLTTEADILPLVTELVPFPTHVFPDPIRYLIEYGSRAIPCDHAFYGLPVLSTLGAAIGNTARIEIKAGWREPPIIWAVLVARSGAIKSPPMRHVLAPIRAEELECHEDHREEMKIHHSMMERYQAELSDWKKDKNRAGDPPEKPNIPVATRYITGDTTIEALGSLLHENPRGLMVAQPELTSLISSFGQYNGNKMADVGKWLSLNDADVFQGDRKTGDCRVYMVPDASACIYGTIQPTTLERVFGPELQDAGLLARFLIAQAPTLHQVLTSDEIPESVTSEWAKIVRGLLSEDVTLSEVGRVVPKVLLLTDAAHRVFKDWVYDHAKEISAASGHLESALSKIKGYCARFALILELVRANVEDRHATQITKESVEDAIELAEFFKTQARLAYDRIDEPEEHRQRRELIENIRNRGGRISVGELAKSGPRRFRGSSDLSKATLADLEKRGYGSLAWETTPKGGRPTHVFTLNDPFTPL